MRTIFVNEQQLDHLYISDKFSIPSFPVEVQSVEVSARAGAVYTGKKVGILDVDIPIVYQNVQQLKSKEVNDLIIRFFNYDNEVPIQIQNEDWYWLGFIEGQFDVPLEKQPFYVFTLKVKLLTPFKYSITDYSNTAFRDQVSINNTGSLELYPVIEATAKKDSTHIMVTKDDDDYIMLGESPTANKSAKKLSPKVLSDELENLVGWSYISNNGTSFGDNETGGKLGGHVKSNTYGFYVDPATYPKGSNEWVGAGVKKSLSRSVQDFEHTFRVRVHDLGDKVNGIGTGKVFTHVWDETGKLVASMGVVDASSSGNDLQVIAKLYDQAGGYENIFKFKPAKDVYLDDSVYMSLKRVGNKWTLTTNTIEIVKNKTKADIAKYGASRQMVRNLVTKTYTDKSKKYMTPIRSASIYLARYDWAGKTPENNKFRALAYAIATNEIFPSTNNVNEIINAGDKIVIDNYNQKMTLNEGDATKYKDFGGNYFGVEKGVHELFIYPENAFDVNVRWQIVDY